MIYIKRSVDFDKNVTWVANNLDISAQRNIGLYAGNSANEAIAAAVAAGATREDAVAQALAELARCNNEVQDTITV